MFSTLPLKTVLLGYHLYFRDIIYWHFTELFGSLTTFYSSFYLSCCYNRRTYHYTDLLKHHSFCILLQIAEELK